MTASLYHSRSSSADGAATTGSGVANGAFMMLPPPVLCARCRTASRRVRAPDTVKRGDFAGDVPRRLPVAHPDLVLLGIEILFPARQRRRFAQLEARIHPPKPGQGSCQD